MPFTRPTLSELVKRTVADMASRLEGTEPQLRRALLRVIAKVHAGAVYLLYGFLSWVAKQLFADTAEGEFLERIASIFGLYRKAATAAEGAAEITGTNGVIVPTGTLWQRNDGVQYTQTADATIALGVATITVVGLVSGEDGNTDAGQTLNIVTAQAGVGSQATVGVDGIAGGTAQESIEGLRIRLLQRLRNKPQGGSSADYEAWALEVAGVTRAWVYPQELGPGTVTVRFAMDTTYNDGIPLTGDVTDVQAHIDTVRPVTANVTVVAPVLTTIAFSIDISPNTVAVQTAITEELADLFRTIEPGGLIRLSHIREAVSRASGEDNNDVTIPAADVALTAGQMPTVGVITWGGL